MAHVPHLHLPGPWRNGEIPVPPETHRHLERVLRRSPGASVTYTDGVGTVGSGVLGPGIVTRGSEELLAPPVPSIRLAVAAPHATERQRFLVEKLAELGVDRLSWLDSVHGEGRTPRPGKAAAWAQGGLEQSRGAWSMHIDGPYRLGELDGPIWAADPAGATTLDALEARAGQVTVAVGPEGGWASGELPEDVTRVSLGPRILRTETAAVAAAVVLVGRRAQGWKPA